MNRKTNAIYQLLRRKLLVSQKAINWTLWFNCMAMFFGDVIARGLQCGAQLVEIGRDLLNGSDPQTNRLRLDSDLTA